MDIKVEFAAYLPARQGAVAVHGEEGARVTFDIPETDIVAAARLIMLRNKPLKVTVEVLE